MLLWFLLVQFLLQFVHDAINPFEYLLLLLLADEEEVRVPLHHAVFNLDPGPKGVRLVDGRICVFQDGLFIANRVEVRVHFVVYAGVQGCELLFLPLQPQHFLFESFLFSVWVIVLLGKVFHFLFDLGLDCICISQFAGILEEPVSFFVARVLVEAVQLADGLVGLILAKGGLFFQHEV